MNVRAIVSTSVMLMMPLLAGAGTIEVIEGTPGDNSKLPATSPSPALSGLINFANLESQITALGSTNASNCDNNGIGCPAFNPTQFASQGVTISSPDGLLIYPFSDQIAGGIELFDPGATDNAGGDAACIADGDCDGTANITVSLASKVTALGVGLSDFDSGLDVTINVLGSAGGTLFSENVSSAMDTAALTTGQTYFVAEDTTPGAIYGLQIVQSANTDGSGVISGN